MRQAILMLLFAANLISVVPFARGQEDPRDRRRKLLEGVLKTLIDSQLDDGRNRPQPLPRPRPIDSRRLRDARESVQRFSAESARLVQHLRQEERLNANFRPILGDALSVQAAGNVLLQRSPALDESQLAREFQSLDRQWRSLSHRLRQTSIDPQCTACVQRLDGIDQQLCQILNVEPQFDRTELIRVSAVLGRDLQNLMEDISIDVRSVQTRHALLLDARKLKSEVDRLGVAAARAPHQELTGQYQQVYAAWRRLANQLRRLDSPYLNRSITRIENSHDRVHELLWLTKAIDRNELLALTRAVQQGVLGVAANVTAADLLALPEPQQALASLRNLVTHCGKLETSIAGDDELDSLVWDYRILAVEWTELNNQLKPLPQPQLQQQLVAAGQSLQLLGQSFGQNLQIDERATIALAASVDDLADQLQRELPQVLSNRYPRSTRDATLQAVGEFHKHAHQFHDDLTNRREMEHLRAHCLELAKAWETLRAHMDRLEPNGRAAVNAARDQISQDLARLQLLYAY